MSSAGILEGRHAAGLTTRVRRLRERTYQTCEARDVLARVDRESGDDPVEPFGLLPLHEAAHARLVRFNAFAREVERGGFREGAARRRLYLQNVRARDHQKEVRLKIF